MPANSSVNLTTVDFDSLKANMKAYLKSQSVFNDYDFDASNISTFLDILSYFTQHNAFYLNMVGSEMFLDSAQLRDSIVSHAKELNYLPRSFRSAYANVNINVKSTDTSKTSLTIPKGTSFTSRSGSKNYTFVTDQNYVVAGANGVFDANNVLIYEGDYVQESYIVNYSNEERYLISNPTVDTTSITVTVIEDNGETTLQYLQATSLFGLTSSSKVFFIQGAEDSKYEIVFGDGVVGRRPKDRSVVIIEYRAGNGELPNGLSKFTSDGAIDGDSNVTVTTNARATGGAVSESEQSIKFNAPRAFTTQERAVTSDDYEILLKANFNDINDIKAFGGEDASPPQYGKVMISVDLKSSDTLPPSRRDVFKRFIKQRSPLSIDPVFVDPVYTYVDVSSTVTYDLNLTSLNEQDIKTLVTSKILDYNSDNLDGFGKTLRYSRLVTAIDSAQSSILSNDTDVRIIKRLEPTTTPTNYDIDFGVQLKNDTGHLHASHNEDVNNVIESSVFLFQSKQCFLEDDGDGNVYVMTSEDDTHTRIKKVGTVDYDNGTIQLVSFNVDGFVGSYIKIYAKARSSDITSERNIILSIVDEDINITVNAVRGGDDT